MKFILTLLAVLIITGCKRDNFSEPNHVYVAGHGLEGALSVAKYWKDGHEVILPGDGVLHSVATGIAVSANDVYVCGTYAGRAAYWKNTLPVPLSDQIVPSYASSIVVSGGDVYVAGSLNGKATYWKNNQPIVLLDTDSFAAGIAVSGNNVYVAGFLSNKTVYWKNGQMVTLGDTTNGFWAKGICVSGNDVYVADQRPGDLGFFTEYWKNGQSVKLDIDNHVILQGNFPVGITVSNNDVYLVTTLSHLSNTGGGTDSFIVYWKNGQPSTINTQIYAYATGIAVLGSDVYVSGYEISNGKYIARYWRNGRGVSLSDGNYDEFADGIVVVPQ